MINQDLKNDIQLRVSKLQSVLKAMKVEACVLSTPVNIFYLSGVVYNGYLYVPQEGEVYHFVKRPITRDLDNVIYIHKPELIVEQLKTREITLPTTLLLEKDVLSYNSLLRLASSFSISVDDIQDASYLLRRIRAEKTNFEIEQVKRCAAIHSKVYGLIPELYKGGMTDFQLQIEIEKQMRLHGSMGIFRSYGENMDIFMGSLLVGDNAAVASPFDFALGGAGTNPLLPLGASGEQITKGKTIMVDMAGNYSPWMTDMTRVYTLGDLPNLAFEAHQLSIDIHNKLMDVCSVGFSCAEMYNIAMDMVLKAGLDAYFMGTDLQAKFIGHGVGLEINELPILTPRSKELITENTVFAIEPKFVIPGVGAVGIENTYLMLSSGLEKLTILDEKIQQIG